MKKTSNKKLKTKDTGHWFSRFSYWFKSLSIIKHIFVFYLFITAIGSLVLYLPISHNVDVSYTDVLFTSASAFSDTGLVTQVTTTTWTYFGQAIIAILIFIGGIGWFALKVYLFNILFGRPISFSAREALASERGSSKIGITRNLIKISVTIMIVIFLLAATILSIYFYFVDVGAHDGPMAEMYRRQHNGKDGLKTINEIPTGNWGTSIRWGLFHSISALNNAGFDIMGEASISPYYNHYGIQFIFMGLFVTGGIGYPVIYDFYLWIRSKITGDKHRWTLFTKISMVTYVSILIISIAVIFAIEVNAKDSVPINSSKSITENHQTFWHNDAYGTKGQKTMALIFNTMSTRNAGFATIDIDMLSSQTLIFYSILMFIGSAPSSTAGGIRTTTFAIALMGVWTRIRGREKMKIFNRRIPTDTTTRAYVVFSVAIVIIFMATIICSTSLSTFGGDLNAKIGTDPTTNQVIFNYSSNDDPYSFTEIFFEVSSAFGTTGLSAGVTPNLSLVAKITLIFVMFIGQLGVSSSVLVWSPKNPDKKHYSFIKEDVSIG